MGNIAEINKIELYTILSQNLLIIHELLENSDVTPFQNLESYGRYLVSFLVLIPFDEEDFSKHLSKVAFFSGLGGGNMEDLVKKFDFGYNYFLYNLDFERKLYHRIKEDPKCEEDVKLWYRFTSSQTSESIILYDAILEILIEDVLLKSQDGSEEISYSDKKLMEDLNLICQLSLDIGHFKTYAKKRIPETISLLHRLDFKRQIDKFAKIYTSEFCTEQREKISKVVKSFEQISQKTHLAEF